MVVGNSADGIETPEIVLHRIVVSVPCNDIEWSVLLGRIEEISIKLSRNAVRFRCRSSIISEGRYRGLEITGIGETV